MRDISDVWSNHNGSREVVKLVDVITLLDVPLKLLPLARNLETSRQHQVAVSLIVLQTGCSIKIPRKCDVIQYTHVCM